MPPDRPNIAMASGITADAGSGRRNSRVGCSQARAVADTADQPPAPRQRTGQPPAEHHAPDGGAGEGGQLAIAQALQQAGQRRLGRGQKGTLLTALLVARGPTTGPAGPPAPPANRRLRPALAGGAFMAGLPCGAPRHLQRRVRGVDRVADEADPEQPGQHQRRVQALLRDHHRVAHAVRVGGDLHRHRHHQRNGHAQPQSHEQPRQHGGQHDPAESAAGGSSSARATSSSCGST
jgi:hypothetical protein